MNTVDLLLKQHRHVLIPAISAGAGQKVKFMVHIEDLAGYIDALCLIAFFPMTFSIVTVAINTVSKLVDREGVDGFPIELN
ncbi:hypothetical protein [Thaumasiovibrio sp. DFM-14]|uniref:hypothetical protein n=1 Tax=Thaumasiovibrio sp. DFM-14 TaxID=3384792 RepID=UPI0039A2D4C1